jgi:alpha-tubulin suppressor-like RCC1 family protein
MVPPALTNAVAVAAGFQHSLGLLANGTVVPWNPSLFAQTNNFPPGLANVVAVDLGAYHSIALRGDGTVVTWGDYYDFLGLPPAFYPMTVPPGLANVAAVAAGDSHCLALRRDGTVVAWGDNSGGQTSVPLGLSKVVAIAGGGYHNLALRADGTVVAWGTNNFGQGTVPPGLMPVVAISAGANHNVVLQADGTVVAWGDNTFGQLNLPPGLANVLAIDAGWWHTLALLANGSVLAWGAGQFIGPPPDWGQSIVPPWAVNVSAVAGGGYHSLALFANGPPFLCGQPLNQSANVGATVLFRVVAAGAFPMSYQWQFNGTNLPAATRAFLLRTNVGPADVGNYQAILNDASGWTTSSVAALALPGLSPPAIVSQPGPSRTVGPGTNVSFLVGATGSGPLRYQWQWGGVALPGATNNALVLTNVTPAQSGTYSVVVSNAYGWTASTNVTLLVQQLFVWGNAALTNLTVGSANVAALAAGYAHSLVLLSSGTVVAWDALGPMSVPYMQYPVMGVAAGFYHSLALQLNGSVVAWGNNSSGQTNVPSGLGSVLAVAGGGQHSLALLANGTVVAWGDNTFGQSAVPPWLTNVVGIAAGSRFSLALTANGVVVAWGDDSQGQVSGAAGRFDVAQISAGGSHGLALQRDGTVAAWGFNLYGQTTVPAGLSQVALVAAGSTHSLALRRNGTVVAWGAGSGPSFLCSGPPPDYCQSLVPTNYLPAASLIAAGGEHSLALCGGNLPYVVTQPPGRTVYRGGTTVLSATATGAAPLSYQWHRNGTNLAGATNASLVLTNLQPAQAGSYWVVVSNAQGTALSWTAQLTVADSAPQILVPPASQAASLGGPATLYCAVAGTQPFAYAWQRNGRPIAGATNALLSLAGLTTNDTALYSVWVTNAVGGTASTSAALTVVPVAQWGLCALLPTQLPASLSNAVALAAGGVWGASFGHALGLKADATVVAWGANNYGQGAVPPGLDKVVAIAAGGGHSLALRADGTVRGWGRNDFGQANDPGVRPVALAAGALHSVAILPNGQVLTWGDCSVGQCSTPLPWTTNVLAVAAGAWHSLALRSDRTVVAWGAGTTNSGVFPHLGQALVPANLANVLALAAGDAHSLALKADGTVVAWGAGATNSGAYPHLGQARVPAGLGNVVAVGAGAANSLAVQADGTVVVWGDNSFGQANAPAWLTNATAVAGGGGSGLAFLGSAPPLCVLGQVVFTGGQITISLLSANGRTYCLEYKPSWAAGWNTILPCVAGTGRWITLTDPAPSGAQRFYRVKVQ